MDTIEKLDRLANLQAHRDLLAIEKAELLKRVIPAEVAAAIEEIEAEFAGKMEAVDANITELEAAVKRDIISLGASVKGANLHAVFTGGRVSWDDKKLSGYMTAHPEIGAFRKVGAPSVSIRRVTS